MPVKVDNPAETFLAFWEAANARPLAEQASLWKMHYAGRYPDVFRLYDAEYGGEATLEAALKRYPEVISNIREVSAEAEAVIAEASQRCAAVLGVPETTDRHVVMVGRFASNAWADLFRGVPTCFYALELIPDVRTLMLMAAHETAHALHIRLTDLSFDGATVAETLMKEGLATAVSKDVVPGFGDEVYLWPGYDVTTEGEGVSAWLKRSEALRRDLSGQLLRDLNSPDPATLGRYFNAGSRYRHARTPTRAGYAVGFWLVRELRRRYRLGDMARWPRGRVRQELAEALIAPQTGF